MQELLIVTHNPDKFAEIQAILEQFRIRCISMADFPHLPPVTEDCPTIEGNAAKKALEIAKATGKICFSDDTGLFIDALGGNPGVFSARWAGKGCSYLDNRQKTLRLLKEHENRCASFQTVIALAAPDGIIGFGRGIVKGCITTEERGENGFGYDSIFEVSGCGLTYAQMDDATKNSLSHRALAIQNALPLIQQIISYTG